MLLCPQQVFECTALDAGVIIILSVIITVTNIIVGAITLIDVTVDTCNSMPYSTKPTVYKISAGANVWPEH